MKFAPVGGAMLQICARWRNKDDEDESEQFRDRWGRFFFFFWTMTRVGPDGFGNRSNDFRYGRDLVFGTDSPIVGVIFSSGVADSAIVGTNGVNLLRRKSVL